MGKAGFQLSLFNCVYNSTLFSECSSACNSSNSTVQPSRRNEVAGLWAQFLSICFINGVLLCILSVLTVAANGCLLLGLYMDPAKHYRHPATVFIIGLALADFLTGFAVEPLFAYFYFRVSRDEITPQNYNTAIKAGGILSAITMNVSFLVILFLSWAQLVSILYPHRHRQIVTTERALACVIAIWIYATLFAFTVLMGVPDYVYQKLDVFIHLTGVHVLILATYIYLNISYKRQLEQLAPFSAEGSEQAVRNERTRKSQRQLVAVNLLLTSCLLVFVLPVTVVWYLTLYWHPVSPVDKIKATIASVIIDTTLFLKFLIDPFIYALRLRKFRTVVVAVVCGRRTSSVLSTNAPIPRSRATTVN